MSEYDSAVTVFCPCCKSIEPSWEEGWQKFVCTSCGTEFKVDVKFSNWEEYAI